MIVRDANRRSSTIHRILSALVLGALTAATVVILGTTATASQTAVDGRSDMSLALDFDTAAPEVWEAFRDAGFIGVQGDGCECLYLPVGTVVQSTTPDHDGTWSVESPDQIIFYPRMHAA